MFRVIRVLAVMLCALWIPEAEVLLAAEPTQGETRGLAPGDAAPPLDVQRWHTSPVPSSQRAFAFEEGHVYIVEFWATWCGSCIAQMPMMAELQESFKDDNVHLLSVSKEKHDVIAEFLSRLVPGKKNVTYRQMASHHMVGSDPDGSVFRDYMSAAGEMAVPKSFIVGKSGKVEWIGNPSMIERPLEAVVKGAWDVQAFKKQYANYQRVLRAVQEIAKFRQQNDDKELLVKKLDRMIRETESSTNDDVILVDDTRQLVETLRGMRLATLFRMGRSDEVSVALQTAFKGADSNPLRAINMANMLVQLPPTLDIDRKSLARAAVNRLRYPGAKIQEGRSQLTYREEAELRRPLILAQLYRILDNDDEAVRVLMKARETTDLISVLDSIDRLLEKIESEKKEE